MRIYTISAMYHAPCHLYERICGSTSVGSWAPEFTEERRGPQAVGPIASTTRTPRGQTPLPSTSPQQHSARRSSSRDRPGASCQPSGRWRRPHPGAFATTRPGTSTSKQRPHGPAVWRSWTCWGTIALGRHVRKTQHDASLKLPSAFKYPHAQNAFTSWTTLYFLPTANARPERKPRTRSENT